MASWQTFYVIIGSAGAALIGIQFVIVTLVANREKRPPLESFSAFGTPTVMHWTSALLVSAAMTVPWPSLLAASVTLVAFGIFGLVYSAIVVRRTHRQTYYVPVWQDWVWFSACPIAAYAVLTAAALSLRARTGPALFGVAAAALGLLLIAIRNAWDSVTHLVVGGGSEDSGDKTQGGQTQGGE